MTQVRYRRRPTGGRAPGLSGWVAWTLGLGAWAFWAGCAAHPGAATIDGSGATLPVTVSTETQATAPMPASGLTVEAGLLAPMPTAVTSFGAASDGERVFVVGGYHGTPHRYSREGQARDIWQLSMTQTDAAWERLGALPTGAQGLAVVYHRGRLCRFGGSLAFNASDAPLDMRSSNTAACFDLQTRTWALLPDLPRGRSSHDAVLVGSRVYVVGGWTLGGTSSEGHFATDALTLDLDRPNDGWQVIAAPRQRRAVGATAAAGKVFVLGGIAPDRSMSRALDIFDPATGQWTTGPDYPEDAFGVALVGMADGSIVASARSGTLWRLRAGQNAWAPAGTLAFPRFFHRLVRDSDGSVVALGGISGMHTYGRTRHVERAWLGRKSPSWLAFSMDWKGRAKNRQAAFIVGDHLYLYGGNTSLGQHDFGPDNFVSEGFRIHLPSLSLERLAPLPAARQSMVVVQQPNRIHLVGGFGHSGHGDQAASQADVWAFDRDTLRFSPVGQLARGRTQFAVATDGADWLVLGGLNYDPRRPGEAAFDHVLDTAVGTATALRPGELQLPEPRRAFASAQLANHFYLVGGMRGGFAPVDQCTVMDLANRTFAALPCPAQTRISATLVPLRGKLHLLGGSVQAEAGLTASRAVDVFDPDDNAWRRLVDALPFEMRHAHVLAYGERILAVSTHNAESRLRVGLWDPGRASFDTQRDVLANIPRGARTSPQAQ